MKWKTKLVAAALALASAAPASAALVDTAAGNSSLFLTVWNSANSYTRNLGTSLDGFLSTYANTTTTFAVGDTTFNTLFGANPTGIQWNIAAGDSQYTSGSDPARVLATGSYTLAYTTVSQNRNGLNIANSGIDQMVLAMNGNGCSGSPSCSVAAPNAGYGGNANWGTNINTGMNFSTVSAGTGDANKLGFYLFSTSASSGTTSIPTGGRSTFTNGTTRGYWTLASNGDAVWNNAAVAAVPVPAAVWLLGSGLMGLVGVARRKQKPSA